MQRWFSCRRVTGWWMVVAFLLIGVIGAYAEEDILALQSRTFREIAKKATPAVVFIEVEQSVEVSANPFFSDPFDFFGDEFFERFFGQRIPRTPQKRIRKGQGSGFIISEDGYILTNNHVVEGADHITVKLADGRELKGKVIGTDPPSDVALIKVDAEDLPTLPLGNSDEIEVGDWVVAVGNPFGLAQTVTVGIVSAKGRSHLNIGNIQYQDFIQTDAAINPGNSGGPLLNLRGEVIGINTAIATRSGGYMGIGFAIPINMAIAVKDQLLKEGKVTRGYLGVLPQDITADMADALDLKSTEGVLISDVEPGTPADKAGLKRGDVVVEFDGKKVTGETQFRNLVAMTPPGKKVTIVVLRDGKRKTLRATIGDRSKALAEATSGREMLEDLGIAVQTLTPELADQLGYEDEKGVVVTQVEPGSPAARAGIRRGTLILEANREKVEKVEDLTKALKDSAQSKKVLLLVKMPGTPYAQYLLIRLD